MGEVKRFTKNNSMYLFFPAFSINDLQLLTKEHRKSNQIFYLKNQNQRKKVHENPTLGINRVTIVSFKFDSEFLTRWGIKERLYSQDNIFSKKSRVS